MILSRFTREFRPVAVGILVLLLLSIPRLPVAGFTRHTLPTSLSDQEFWELTERISEPDGYFRSNSGSTDNLLSNETMVSSVAAALADRVKPSGVYLGVGPEQNFTYIAAIHPQIAFIADIRRGNLLLHLMYKSIFEMSATRAEFVSRLFTRKQPAGLTAKSTGAELMSAYMRATPGDATAFKANLDAITDHLTKTRKLPLSTDDLAGVTYVYQNFYRFGPGISYASSSSGRPGASTYAQLMASKDVATGAERTYLASESNFAIVKTMESQNLIVPIVGDFAGPKALRAVSAYLKEHDAIVNAFYVSNVEQYLQGNGVWPKFCANVANMPLDMTSTFIRPSGGRATWFGAIAAEISNCASR